MTEHHHRLVKVIKSVVLGSRTCGVPFLASQQRSHSLSLHPTWISPLNARFFRSLVASLALEMNFMPPFHYRTLHRSHAGLFLTLNASPSPGYRSRDARRCKKKATFSRLTLRPSLSTSVHSPFLFTCSLKHCSDSQNFL